MQTFKAQFREKVERTPTVTSFRFVPEKPVDFIPGQFAQLVFDGASAANKELNKYLSFSCPPGKGYLEFTKRLSGSVFSQRLNGLRPGDEILLKAPLGSCTFNAEYERIGFLIGGIGITPAISIIGYIFEKELACDVCLVYSNRTVEEIAFKKELDAWRSQRDNIRVVYTVTDCEPQDKTCLFGSITPQLVKERMCDVADRAMFIFGPPRMVEAMKDLSQGLGVKQENIKTEVFVGY